jgi:hypothetical protein
VVFTSQIFDWAHLPSQGDFAGPSTVHGCNASWKDMEGYGRIWKDILQDTRIKT